MINNIDYLNYNATTTGAVSQQDFYRELIVKFTGYKPPIVVKNTLGFTPTFTTIDDGVYGINYNNASIATDTQKVFTGSCAVDAGNSARLFLVKDNFSSTDTNAPQQNNAIFACVNPVDPNLLDAPILTATDQYDILDFRYYDGTIATATSEHVTGQVYIPFADFLLVAITLSFTILAVWFTYSLLYKKRK